MQATKEWEASELLHAYSERESEYQYKCDSIAN